jgi:hypothetical protein
MWFSFPKNRKVNTAGRANGEFLWAGTDTGWPQARNPRRQKQKKPPDISSEGFFLNGVVALANYLPFKFFSRL